MKKDDMIKQVFPALLSFSRPLASIANLSNFAMFIFSYF